MFQCLSSVTRANFGLSSAGDAINDGQSLPPRSFVLAETPCGNNYMYVYVLRLIGAVCWQAVTVFIWCRVNDFDFLTKLADMRYGHWIAGQDTGTIFGYFSFLGWAWITNKNKINQTSIIPFFCQCTVKNHKDPQSNNNGFKLSLSNGSALRM